MEDTLFSQTISDNPLLFVALILVARLLIPQIWPCHRPCWRENLSREEGFTLPAESTIKSIYTKTLIPVPCPSQQRSRMLCFSRLDWVDPAGRAKVFTEKSRPGFEGDPTIRKGLPRYPSSRTMLFFSCVNGSSPRFVRKCMKRWLAQVSSDRGVIFCQGQFFWLAQLVLVSAVKLLFFSLAEACWYWVLWVSKRREEVSVVVCF